MKIKSLLILMALAFLVFNCVIATPKPSPQSGDRPTMAELTSDPGSSPYYLGNFHGPFLSAVEASALEDAIRKFHLRLPDSHGPLVSAVEASGKENTIRKFQRFK